MEDLEPEEIEKLENAQWLRRQVDHKVMVKKDKEEPWQDFTGLFLMSKGWNGENVSTHIKEQFSTEQFRPYTFGLFKRYYISTTNNVNNNFQFKYLHAIKLLENDLSLD